LKKFIFDVDGTLTDSRQQIDLSFEAFMIKFCCKNDVYLVTGSDREKTVEQVGLDVYYRAKRVYNCSGADVYEKDVNVYKSNWTISDEVKKFLQDELDYSQFPIRCGNHIEERPGGINFSILGRGEGVNLADREEYVKWDRNTGERVLIADRLKNQFPNLNVQIGGQTGLDISDNDKSQILRDFNSDDEIHFFGDMMKEGQNDYPLAVAVDNAGGTNYTVNSWQETYKKLKDLTPK
jgi:phosphomannomutase